ncbi:hypothetical protein [Shewanella algae]|uniref:hypothetical protein n=1 Tax=Shewanella algae TaxID=38313 RepID=UPI001AAE1697|nr:hypothetical protein [Shewanella algae]MBO2650816.1 hypothetical protein [Shewanella algae]
MLLKEVLKSLSGNMRERVSSPLLGSYTIAAAAVNWKSIVVLFTSKNTGTKLVEEVLSVTPEIEVAIGYPIAIAIAISVVYPSLRAVISTFNAYARIFEIKAEFRLENIKEQLNIKKDPIENLIKHLHEGGYYEKVGYHDLKRLMEYLPDEESLLIKSKEERNL